MTANVEAMVREGIKAYRAGKKAEARALLEKAVELDQFNEQGWLWLSAIVETPEEQRTCLENVLFINPNNTSAKQGLQMLSGGGPKAAPPPTTDKPTTTSVEWDEPPTATSSPSAAPRGKETSAVEYDNWVAGLGLAKGSEEQKPKLFDEEAFADQNIFDSGFFDDDDDDSAPIAPPKPAPAGGLMGDDEDFDADLFDSNAFSMPDDDFASPAPAKSAPVKKSPSKTSPKSPTPEKEHLAAGAFTLDDDYDSGRMDDPDPSEYFQLIPKDITPTRLPGTVERVSPVALLGIIVLLMLNVGALVMLVSSFAN